MGPRVIVTVVRGEHRAVWAPGRIVTGVTWVHGHAKGVVGLFWLHSERTVFSVVPAEINTWLQIKSQLVAACRCQLMKYFVAEPVVAKRVVESNFKLRPRTVEEGKSTVDVLLD